MDSNMDSNKIGKFLEAKRHEKSLSRRALARRCGVSPSHLQRIERGGAPVSTALANRLARHLECDADYVQIMAGRFPADLLFYLQQHPDTCLDTCARLRAQEKKTEENPIVEGGGHLQVTTGSGQNRV